LDSHDRYETSRAPLGSLWSAIRRWLVAQTFAPPFLSGRWSHPAVGYLLAVLLQVITVTGLVEVIRLFPSFQFQEALVILVVLVVALAWGVGPGLLATLVGAVLLTLLLLPPTFSFMLARIEDGLNLLVYLGVGLAVSFLASQVQQARRTADGLRRRLDTIIEALPDALSIHDAAGRSVRLNRAAHQLLGHHPPGTQADVSPTFDGGVASGETFPSGDLSCVARALDGETVRAVETRLSDAQGHERVLITNAAPFYNPEGQVEGAVLISHDVSALREAEREAAARARQLEAILEAMTDAVVVHDSEGQVILLNAAAERIHPLGRTVYASQTLSQRGSQFLPRDEQGQPLPVEQWPLQRILRGEVLTGIHAVDVLVRLADRHERLMNFSGAPIRDANGGVIGSVILGRDVTEQRRLEESERRLHVETEARRALLQLILETLPISAYLVRGRDAQLVLANRAATTLWGASWRKDQPMGEFLRENGIRIFDRDGRPLEPVHLATLRALHRGETVLQHQETIRHPDGTALPVQVNAVALDMRQLNLSPSDEGTRPSEASEPAAIVVHQDVSVLKETEALKDVFIGLFAHELCTPIAVLTGFAQTLLAHSEHGNDTQLSLWQREALQGIDQAALQLAKLTEDLLDVTRVQAGRLELSRELTDLVALCRRVVARFQRTAAQHTLSLETSLDHLVAQVDPKRMEQVLGNLLSNAIKYSPGGGPIQVGLREVIEAQTAHLSVHDRGIGIPARQQAGIFGRFERADNSRPYGISGTGLGLYLCRALVEQHGGRIWFESVEGEGSTFFIALPLASEAAPARL
jgi:PAS domain S-box-containing protein